MMPVLVSDLSSKPSTIKSGVAIFFLGLAVSLFLSGPMIDGLGTRRSFWISFMLFLGGTVVCSLSNDAAILLIGRFIQGSALGVIQILSKSLLTLHQDRAELLSVYSMLINLSAPVSMLLSSALLYFFPWQACFIFLFTLATLTLAYGVYHIPEDATEPSEKRPLVDHLKIYYALIKTRCFVMLVLSYALFFSIMAPYYVTTSYTLVTVLHYKMHVIGLIGGIFSSVNLIGSYCYLHVEKTRWKSYIIPISFVATALSTLALYCLTFIYPLSLNALVYPLLLSCFVGSLMYPQLNATIISQFENHKNMTLSAMASFHSHLVLTQTAQLMLVQVVMAAVFYRLATR